MIAAKNFCIVPGLHDDSRQGVHRSKFTLQGDEIIEIFSEVIVEIITLVKGQIAATKTNVKAVLLVGGFGESPYLRKSIRAAVGCEVEVLVPANRYVMHLGMTFPMTSS